LCTLLSLFVSTARQLNLLPDKIDSSLDLLLFSRDIILTIESHGLVGNGSM